MADNAEGGILVENGVSLNLVPFCKIAWGSQQAQMTPEEMRGLAQSLMHCAEAAEHDAMLARFIRQVGFPPQTMAGVLTEFRKYRREQAEGLPPPSPHEP